MHGLLHFFRLLLKINIRFAQKKLPILIEEDLRGGLPPASTEQWLDNQDLRQKLHMSQSILRRHRLEGTISYMRINGKYYYRKSDIEKLMDRYSHNHLRVKTVQIGSSWPATDHRQLTTDN